MRVLELLLYLRNSTVLLTAGCKMKAEREREREREEKERTSQHEKWR